MERNYFFPSEEAFGITPSDTATLIMIGAIYVGGTGNVRVRYKHNGATVTFTNVPAGTYVVGNFDRVWATGTTATNLIGQR